MSTISGANADTAPALKITYRPQAGSVVGAVVVVSLVLFVAAQLVPVSRDNPPAKTTIKWDSSQTEQLWQRACADCHSNTTQWPWPWYASFAPSSWLLAIHVNNARQRFNSSDTSSVPAFMASQFPNEAQQQINMGAMPPADYLILHPAARLSDSEKQQLIQGLKNSLGQ
jgi:hypothetical protein